MTQNFPTIFPPGRELNINFDWTDFSSGTGYVLYDGIASDLTAGVDYLLVSSGSSTNMVGSKGVATTQGANQTTVAKGLDLDFDTSEFQVSQTVSGTAIIRVGYIIADTLASPHSGYVIAKLRKWDGASETEIASGTSATKAGADSTEYASTITFDIPQTTIKKGETLRVTIEGWYGRTSGADEVYMEIYHYPLDTAISTGSNQNTKLQIAIPFKINV